MTCPKEFLRLVPDRLPFFFVKLSSSCVKGDSQPQFEFIEVLVVSIRLLVVAIGFLEFHRLFGVLISKLEFL